MEPRLPWNYTLFKIRGFPSFFVSILTFYDRINIGGKVKSIYIHIPFCSNICSYCDFCKMYYNESLADEYLDRLEKEIKLRYKKEKIETIYIGGGTPSCLTRKQMKKLFKILSIFKTIHLKEFTFECNIDSITEEKIKFLKANKVNRISIGIETINKEILKDINRYHTKEDIIQKINMVKRYIPNINVDLMYGFKKETIDVLKKDLDFVMHLDIKHISIYSLILEKNTKFSIENYQRVDDEMDRNMYDYIRKYLKEKGFIHYEISNFSKKGYFSLHNNIYWANKKYYGFGLGSGSYVGKNRLTNTRSINEYLKGNYVLEKEELTKEDEMIYEVILALRRIKGISLSSFYQKYNVDLFDKFDIIDLVDKNILMVKDDYLYINSAYLYVSNSILERFLEVV